MRKMTDFCTKKKQKKNHIQNVFQHTNFNNKLNVHKTMTKTV